MRKGEMLAKDRRGRGDYGRRNIGAFAAYTIDPAFMAKKAEELGFDSIWYAEHPVLPVSSESQFPSGGLYRSLTPTSPTRTLPWRGRRRSPPPSSWVRG